MSESPVYLAGSGLACALGRDLPECLTALKRGGVSPTPVTVAEGFTWPFFALPPEEGTWLQRLRRTVRAVVAQCGLPDPASTPDMPLFVASSSLDVGYEEEAGLLANDVQNFADVVAEAIGWRGPVFTVSTACTSAVNAVLAASDLIRSGAVPHALVLGIEFGNRLTLAGFGGMQLLSPDRARPFGAARNGLVLGEAVAAMVLRSEPSRWRLAGGANVVAGAVPTGADAGAILAVCKAALRQAGLRAQEIGLVKPQAAGSPVNDAVEADTLGQLFGTLPPMIAFKQLIGHTLGAAGAAELVLLTACIETRAWPVADHAPDPALDVVFATQMPVLLRHILLNAIGFGGGHAALVLEGLRDAAFAMSDHDIPGWRLAAHVVADPPPPDWRNAVAARLGERPRRIGVWAELALHGAWQCLDAAGESVLPTGARLRVASLSGSQSATRASLAQLRSGLPMPFDFMQSQSGLMLAAVAKGLGWQGDASFMVCRSVPLLTRACLHGAGPEGLLLGWIEEEGDALRSEWWRWRPA